MTHATPRAGSKEWLGLAVLGLTCLLLTMDIGVLFFAVPTISEDLKPSGTQLLWIMDAYGFALAALLVTVGWVGDRIGRRLLLMIGSAAFSAASLCAAFSSGPEMLIASRAALGVAAASLTPTTLAMIRNMFRDEKQRKTALAVWSGALTAGASIGPIVGGLMLQYFWWGSVFLINLPVMVLLLILAPLILPESKNPNPGRFDLLGVVLSLGAIVLVIYGIKEWAINGYTPVRVGCVVLGTAIAVLFVRRQSKSEHPLVDVSLFRYRAFSGSVIVNLMVMVSFVGISLSTNQFMQLVMGMKPLVAALWGLAVTPVIGIAIGVSSALSSKFRPGNIIAGGLVVMAAGFAVLTQLEVDSPIWYLLIGIAALPAGMLVVKTLVAEIVVTAAPAEKAGSSAAVSETASELGGALGFASLGSVAAAFYHHTMNGVSAPGLPGPALAAARDTLGGALTVSHQLPGNQGSALLGSARSAFTSGLNAAALTGGVALLVTAALVAFLLRNVTKTSTATKSADDVAVDDVPGVGIAKSSAAG